MARSAVLSKKFTPYPEDIVDNVLSFNKHIDMGRVLSMSLDGGHSFLERNKNTVQPSSPSN
jgi:hypothetical protein